SARMTPIAIDGVPPASFTPRGDGGAADLVGIVLLAQPLRLPEGLGDPLQRVGVRDDLGEGILPEVRLQEDQRPLDRPRLGLDHADDGLRPPHELGRMKLHRERRADGADLQVGAARLQHLEPLGITLGKPTKSQTTSAPHPRVSSRTAATRSSGLGSSWRLSVWSAPNRRASSSRSAIWSMTMTFAAPISLATALAFSPIPPAPCLTTVWPVRRRTRSRR